jgi:hypothetical protein
LLAGLLALAFAFEAALAGLALAAAFDIALAAVEAAFEAAFAALAIVLAAFAIALAALAIAFAAVLAAFAALFAAVFVFAASPQAIPRAPIARTAERAITFFILKILLSSSKIRSKFIVSKTVYTSALSHVFLKFSGTLHNIVSVGD